MKFCIMYIYRKTQQLQFLRVLFAVNMNNGDIEKVKLITLKSDKGQQEKYMLSQNLLGKGKYGKVYKAICVNDHNKEFAVKVIKLQSEKVKKECLDELQNIKKLPESALNVCKIYPFHLQSDNHFYIFQQYCDGGNLADLRQRRKNQPFTEQEVFNMFFQIVNGFLALRSKGIFHEDIKPQNILLKNNIYKFTDFGISQLATSKVEASQIRRGTLLYMPPQKLKGRTFTPTSKTQIFSLGVTLFEMIFGYHPYMNKTPIDYKQYLKILQESQSKSLEELKNRFPSHSLCIDKLIRIILQMIEINDTKRLTLDELQCYIKKTEPFQYMVVTNEEPIAKIKRPPSKYEITGHSNVVMQSQGSLGDLLLNTSVKDNTNQYRTCLSLFRDCAAHFQQGIAYLKKSKNSQFKQVQSKSDVGLNGLSKITQIEFLTLIFLERMFDEFKRITTDYYILQSDICESNCSYEVIEDIQFINNEFLKFYFDVPIQNKKEAWIASKEKSTELAQIIAQECQKIFKLINCIKINFKEDLLSLLFIKEVPTVIRYLKLLLDSIVSNNYIKLLDDLNSAEYSKIKQILFDFSEMERQNAKKVYKIFEDKIKGHEIIQDVESNSDEFEILDDHQ